MTYYRKLCVLLMAGLLGFAPQIASAQKYPDRPVRIIVPLGPGGVGDISTRIVAEKLGEKLGHRFVVELPEEPLAATADPEKLRQVCAILVDNALRYSPDGGTVTVGSPPEFERAVTPAGAPADDRPADFETAFVRFLHERGH